MRSRPIRTIWQVILFGVACLLGLCAIASVVSTVANLSLPKASKDTAKLGSVDKAMLSEAIHLQRTLGNSVWPGWSDANVPFIVYNEQYAFLVGYADPPSGWLKVPQNETRGAAWEIVPVDSFEGTRYYRQRLLDPKQTPEAFAVLVGDQWVASFETKEHAEISLYNGLREQLPPVVRVVAPYRLLWILLAGGSDGYITLLLHEAFHAYQGTVNPDLFAQSEEAMRMQNAYPWVDASQQEAWQKELELLAAAATANSDSQAAILAKQFLDQRDARRVHASMAPELVDFEQKREWLEGLAKYAELEIGRVAATTPGYEPLPELADSHEFHAYASRDWFWHVQLDQVRQILNNEGEIRFYYSGFAQAVLLDRLSPGWKERALAGGESLESLLREAVSRR